MITKLQVHRLLVCKYNNSGNFKKKLDVIKMENGSHIADSMYILIGEIHYQFFVNQNDLNVH